MSLRIFRPNRNVVGARYRGRHRAGVAKPTDAVAVTETVEEDPKGSEETNEDPKGGELSDEEPIVVTGADEDHTNAPTE